MHPSPSSIWSFSVSYALPPHILLLLLHFIYLPLTYLFAFLSYFPRIGLFFLSFFLLYSPSFVLHPSTSISLIYPYFAISIIPPSSTSISSFPPPAHFAFPIPNSTFLFCISFISSLSTF